MQSDSLVGRKMQFRRLAVFDGFFHCRTGDPRYNSS